MAGRVIQAIDPISNHHPSQRVVLCSHGDTIPLAIAYLAAHHGTELPPPIYRGGWYEVDDTTITAQGPLLDTNRRLHNKPGLP